MTVHNREIAAAFARIADLLEIRGDNPFRVRAYREAARVLEDMTEPVERMVKDGADLTRIKGIGKDLAEKIKAFVETGRLEYLEKLESEIPASLLELMKIPDLGPRRVAVIHKELGIETVEELRAAIETGKISSLKGFGEKSEQKIFHALSEIPNKKNHRMLLADVAASASSFQKYLEEQPGVERVSLAGSYRRGKETVGDLDILVICREGFEETVMASFVRFGEVARVLSRGTTKSAVVLRSTLQVDLRIVERSSYGSAMHYFTGSRAHNIAIRKLAVQNKYKINEYGVFEEGKKIAGETESGLYEAMGLRYIAPELRENLGEVEAARENRLPRLIGISDIRGDLHMHTTRTDGRNTLAEMAAAARDLGYEYIAITEHSRKVAMAGGLDESGLRQYMAVIDAENEKIDGITILKGIEVDILPGGELDLPDSVLRDLDIVVGSVHYQQRFPVRQQTERVIRAMDNPHLQILGHPTGRLLNRREPMDIDLERIIEAAKERDVIIELNAQPDRLDLPHNYCKLAAEIGVPIAVSTDAHSTENLLRMKNGITEARRGWLTRQDVINTRPLAEMTGMLRRR